MAEPEIHVEELKQDAEFLATSTLGDLLEVTTTLVKMKNSSLELLQEIYKEGKKVFSMTVILVHVDDGVPTRIPEELRDIFIHFK